MSHHLTERGTFKSDKYDWCPEGFFALKLTDPIAQRCALLYAALTDDVELAEDLRVVVPPVDLLVLDDARRVLSWRYGKNVPEQLALRLAGALIAAEDRGRAKAVGP